MKSLARGLFLVVLARALLSCSHPAEGGDSGSQAAAPTPEAFVGAWALEMHGGAAGWLSIERPDGEWSAELWTVGQRRAVTDLAYSDGELGFTRRVRMGEPEYPGGPATGKRVPCHFRARVEGDAIRVARFPEPSTAPDRLHVGRRLPPLPPRPDLTKLRFGEPIELFNGRDLSGWRLTNPEQKNGWRVEDGVLVNETPKTTFDPFSRYGNLRTERTFGDGRLSIEFFVEADGNSGIYVRGAYEAQVVGRDSPKMQGIQGVGAIFGRIEPSKNAGKLGGEWQRYEITLVDRHVTVVLNGERVIDNQALLGNTNGACQADVMSPGPLMLQGDHTAVKYRNIVFEPVR